MLVRADGSIVGTIGGGASEALVVEDARERASGGAAGPTVKRYSFTEKRDPTPSAWRAAAVRRLGVTGVHLCDSDDQGGVLAITAGSSVAVVTRCHRTDQLALRRVLREPLRHLGLIGSRRKKAVLFELLRREGGASDAELERVRCPIGLPLGGDTPEEIAVSIVTELLRERYLARSS